MRIRRPLPILVTGALLLGVSQFAVAASVSAQPFGYKMLTPNQQKHVSGLLALELGGADLRTPAARGRRRTR